MFDRLSLWIGFANTHISTTLHGVEILKIIFLQAIFLLVFQILHTFVKSKSI